MLHLVTGHTGKAHISAVDVANFNAGIFGSGTYVLPTGTQFQAVVESNNTVNISGGEMIIQGRHIRMPYAEVHPVSISNGTAGVNRADLIVIRYTNDFETGVENVEFAVIEGTETDGTPILPTYQTGDLLSGGCAVHEEPLYKIPINGLTIGEPERLISEMHGLDNAMVFKGWNPISSKAEDTPQKWKELGTGIWMIDLPDRINGQPSQWGFLYNTVCAEEVAQKFIIQASGETFRRNANGIGWYGNDWRDGSWTLVYDGESAPFMADGYHGTGTNGSGGACKLFFPFKPKFVIILDGQNYMFLHHFKPDAYYIYGSGDTGQPRKNTVTFGDNSVEWYSSNNADYQMNDSGVYYHYAAWG